MRCRIVAVLALGAVVLAACADDDGGAVDADSTVTASTTTSTTAPASTTTGPTSTTPVQTPLPSGRDAVDAVMAAWQAGDQAAALRVASPEAVTALFAIAPERAEARGCNTTDVQVDVQCVFRLGAGELSVRAAPTADGTGFLVDFVILGS